VKGIRNITDDPDQILPLLIRSLEDQAWEIRRSAATELGEMEEAAAPAVPALLAMLRADDDSDAARRALGEINTAGEEAVPLLMEIIQDASAGRRARYYSLFILRKMGARAKSALPVLEKLEKERDGRQREYIQRAIQEIKGDD
jgi:HEAT repeat protein